ncbi:sodium channel protein Nach-like [Bacillus rossius redtenbacheri]|uniref:sodium channel protein Nach-like n=1 Tax=Bacillus rossius redtenbacheri TaxID=93214 RepID=UPI002FDE14A5
MDRVKNYCLNSSLHGLRYIAEPDSHWIERVFWVCCCLASWLYAARIIAESLAQYSAGSISFVVETTYLEWNTEFPSVSVCQKEDLGGAESYLLRLVSAWHLGLVPTRCAWVLVKPNASEDELFSETLVVNEIAFFMGIGDEMSNCEDIDCPADGMRAIADQIRKPCQQLLRRCEWNSQPFSCCKHFLLLDSEMGPCFAINNIQAKNFSRKTKFPMISNMSTGPGTLKILVNAPSIVYLTSKEDVPNIATKKNAVKLDAREEIRFYVADVDNEAEVKGVSLEQRQCRFPDENYLGEYPHYAHSACIASCHRAAQLGACNCTSHFTPGTREELFCDLKGLQCLHRHRAALMTVADEWDDERPGLHCHCLQSCEEVDLTVFYKSSQPAREELGYAEVSIVMDHLPSERYMRKVVRDKLDMVGGRVAVSTGSTIGLFLGASLLSLVELIHYFVLPAFERRHAARVAPGNEAPAPLVITHPRFARLGARLAGPGHVNVIHVR